MDPYRLRTWGDRLGWAGDKYSNVKIKAREAEIADEATK